MTSFYDLQSQALDSNSEHWIVNEDADLNDCSELTELLQIGSVTIEIAGKKYVLAFQVEAIL